MRIHKIILILRLRPRVNTVAIDNCFIRNRGIYQDLALGLFEPPNG